MTSPLPRLVREIEEHVAAAGWDQPTRLYALVPTADLLAREPGLADVIGGVAPGSEAVAELTALEQEELPAHASVEELLAGLAWPPDVAGVALVVERVFLPPEVEADLPDDEDAALALLRSHPLRQDVRLTVAALRGGDRLSAMRFRLHDDAAQVLLGPDLVPQLAEALAATLED